MYIHVAPGQGLTTPRGRNFYVNRNILSLWSFVASFKKNLFEVWFYAIFFMILYMYIAPGQGQTAPRGQNLDVNRKALSLYPFVASFKEISLKSDFIHFFHDLIHVYSPRAGGIQPPGDKIWCQQKLLVTSVIVISFIWCKFSKKCLWSLILYNLFYDLIHVYSPGAGADSPQGTKFGCQQKGIITLPICCKFQRNLFEVWFYTFFSWFNTCI